MNIFLLWQRAVPLSEAWKRFSPQDRIEALSAVGQNIAPIAAHEDQQNLLKIAHGLDLFGKYILEQSGHIRELQAGLVHRIMCIDLISYGFVFPRKADDCPIEIPPDLWQCAIDWKKSEIEGHGLKLSGVRLLPASWVPKILVETAKANIESIRPGRPSLRPEIEAAYAALRAADRIDLSRSLSSHFPAIVAFVKAHAGITDDKPRGLSDKLLYKVLGDIYHDDQLMEGIL